MPPTKIVIDDQGNRYYKDVVSRIFLVLKDRPKNGKQSRCLGSTKRGIWLITRDQNTWMLKDKCWYVNAYVLQNAKLFNFNLCRLSGVNEFGVLEQGFFYPEFILKKYEQRICYRSYELQVEVHPEDLCDTYDEAKDRWKDLRAELMPPEPPEIPQGSLFT
jgi:hypothetical protein